MCKNISRLILVLLIVAFADHSIASKNPNLPEKKKVESDSLSVTKDNNTLLATEVKSQPSSTESTSVSFWQKSEEVEEDSTSNSALSFNFIYYIIEKFKFQVE